MGLTPWKKTEFWTPSPQWLHPGKKPPKPTLNNKRALVSVRSYPVCAPHLNQSRKASHYKNWSSRNQMVSENLVTQEILSRLNHPSALAATCLSKIIITSAMLLVIKPVKNSRRALVIKARMKICWIWKYVEMLSQTKPFPFLKNTMSCKETWMSLSDVNQLSLWLLGLVLYILNAWLTSSW